MRNFPGYALFFLLSLLPIASSAAGPADFERSLYRQLMKDEIAELESKAADLLDSKVKLDDSGLPKSDAAKDREAAEGYMKRADLLRSILASPPDENPKERSKSVTVAGPRTSRLDDLQTSESLAVGWVMGPIHSVDVDEYDFSWNGGLLMQLTRYHPIQDTEVYVPVLVTSEERRMIDRYMPVPGDVQQVEAEGDMMTIGILHPGEREARTEECSPPAGEGLVLWCALCDHARLATQAHAEAEKLRAFEKTLSK